MNHSTSAPPRWSAEELREGAKIVEQVESCRSPRRQRETADRDLSLRAALPLLEGLGAGTRAVFVRQFLNTLGFDEHHHARWRLEHKLVQALLLQAYLPELVPVTRGFSAWVAGRDCPAVEGSIRAEFPGGYLIKSALGDSSGDRSGHQEAADVLARALGASGVPARNLVEEQYIIQQRIPIAQEYRVHTLEDQVVEDLTFHRYEGGSIPGERVVPNRFVQSALERLPGAIVGGSLLAWDVAMDERKNFAIVEINFSGFHPVYKRGFHCSGYFHDHHWGACDTARLINHVARVDGVRITVHADAPEHPELNRFYADIAAWQVRHNA